MSEPEIARRCLSCGASVRGAARYCPQCGQPMADGAGVAATPALSSPRTPLVEEAERVATSISGRLVAREPDAHTPDDVAREAANVNAADAHIADERATRRNAGVEQPVAGDVADDQDAASRASASTANDVRASTSVAGESTSVADESATVADDSTVVADQSGAGRVRQRASAVGASVGESLRPRVERLRERSVVVLDDAADDPGVRFVVVAAALFIIALLLYVVSFVLR